MLSLLKVLFTLAVVYVVWFVFKYRARIAAAHRTVMDEKARAARAQRGTAKTPVAQDLLPCPKCGAYVAAGTICTCTKV